MDSSLYITCDKSNKLEEKCASLKSVPSESVYCPNGVSMECSHAPNQTPTVKSGIILKIMPIIHSQPEQTWFMLPEELGLSNYVISREGKVRNYKRRKISSKVTLNGDCRVSLMDDKRLLSSYLIHDLVALTFIPNPQNFKYVHHINGKQNDNRVENLEWSDFPEAKLKWSDSQEEKLKCTSSKIRPYILQKNENHVNIGIWDSVQKASEETGIMERSIKDACSNRRLSHGFLWSFYFPVIVGEVWKKLMVGNRTIEVSSIGKIKLSINHITFGNKHLGGYYTIFINGQTHKVDRLVMQGFEPNSNYFNSIVEHLDGNKFNNHISNLSWRQRRPGERIPGSGGRKKMVKRIDTNDQVIAIYQSLTEAAKAAKLSAGSMSRICREDKCAANGDRWEYC